jgi:RNA polymerase sigma factor (sigma-70 family)
VADERTDTELLRRAYDDPSAFEEFYRRHMLSLSGWLYRRTHDGEVAHALAQESMANAWRAVRKPRKDVEHPKAWLYTIAHRELARWRRSSMLEMPSAEALGLSVEAPPSRIDRIIEHADLYEALDELSDEDALLLVFVDVMGMPQADAAALLGRNIEGAKKRVQRSRRRLRAVLE